MTEYQNWVKETLLSVAQDDPDGAYERNHVGFGKFDGDIGHSLANQLRSEKQLSPAQWRVAAKLAQRYKRQAPQPEPARPSEEELQEAVKGQQLAYVAKQSAESYVRVKLEQGALVTEAQGRIAKDLFFSINSLLKSLGFKFQPASACWSLPGNRIEDGPGVIKCFESQPGVRLDAAASTFLSHLAPAQPLPAYAYHIPTQAYPYQRDGIEWLHNKNQAIFADQMGLGKTVQALSALDPRQPVLIVAPKAAKAVWIREAAQWRPDITIGQIKKPADFRFPKPGEVLVCNYEQFPKLKVEDPDNGNTMESKIAYELAPGTIIIADEAHALKNTSALRSKRYKSMVRAILAMKGKVWNLTGTPVLNRQQELWGILSSMCAEKIIFPGGWPQFLADCDGRQGRYGTEWGNRVNPEVAIRLQQIMLRRTRQEVFSQTPPKVREFYPVEINKAFKAKLDLLWLTMGDHPQDPENFLDDVMSKGILFEQISKLRRELAEVKTAALLTLIDDLEEQGETVCVASAHRLPIDLLGKRAGWKAITGDTSADERGRIQDAFQAGELKGVAFTIKAGGVGISLHKGTSKMIFVDLEWTPALNAQAEDRLRPHLQQQSCVYTILQVDHKLEKRINEALVYKAKLLEKIYSGEGG